jgi:hypothetical protein
MMEPRTGFFAGGSAASNRIEQIERKNSRDRKEEMVLMGQIQTYVIDVPFNRDSKFVITDEGYRANSTRQSHKKTPAEAQAGLDVTLLFS